MLNRELALKAKENRVSLNRSLPFCAHKDARLRNMVLHSARTNVGPAIGVVADEDFLSGDRRGDRYLWTDYQDDY